MVNEDDWAASLGRMYDSDMGRGADGDTGEVRATDDAERWSGCFWNHLRENRQYKDRSIEARVDKTNFAQLPDSVPRHAPIQGCPTPNFLPLQVISKGSFTPR